MQEAQSSPARARVLLTRCIGMIGVGVAMVACSDATTAPELSSTNALLVAATALTHPVGIVGTQVPLGGGPWGVDVSSTGVVYVTQLFSNQVAVSSITGQTITGEVSVGTAPTAVAFSPDGRTAYVTNQLDGNVGVINVATGVQTATIPLPGANPFAVVASPDGTQIFISSNQTSVYVADAHTLAIVDAIPVGDAPNAFALSPNGKDFFVSSFVGGTVTEFNIASHAVVRTYVTGGTPQGLTTNKKGTELYVANENGFVTLFSTTTGAVLATLPLAGGGFGAAVTPDDNHLYIAEPGPGLVQLIDLQNRKLKSTINVGGSPRRIAFSSQGKVGVVTNQAGYISFIK